MLGNPTYAPRIVPFGAARVPSDRLPNGHPGFRVTQRFNDLDAFFHDRPHGAMDIANYYCGDQMRAMISGRAERVSDPNGALGIRITSSDRIYQVGIWHLATYGVADGVTVTKGQVIGTAGSTGLDIDGCHAHIALNVRGVPRDPWGYLDQNVTKKAKFNATTGINTRVGPGTLGGTLTAIYASLTKGRVIRADGKDLGAVASSYTAKNAVAGATHGLGSTATLKKSWTPIYIAGGYRYVATPLITYL